MAEGTGRVAVALNGYGLANEDGSRDVLPWHEVVLMAETAEQTGYEALFVPEIGAREAFSTLAGFAGVTFRIRLITGVVPVGSRDARRMAMEAATLHDLSGGRFVLGVGSREPIDRTREELRLIRALLAGEDPLVEESGETLALGRLDLFPGRLPIYLAALGSRMTRLAGEVADGVILNWCTPERVTRARDELARGAADAGRDPDRLTVAVYVRACLGHERPHALAALREATAQYAGMAYYRRQFEAMGLGKEAEAASAGEVPDALVEAVCIRGGRGEALARIGDYHEAGADLVVVYPVPALDAVSSITGSILAAAPNPAVER